MISSSTRRLRTLAYWAEDLSVGLVRALRIPLRPLGNRFKKFSRDDACAYAVNVRNLYAHYAPGAIRCRVCEIGPGDSLAMGVAHLGAGADRVDFVDRFPIAPGPEDEAVVQQLYASHHTDFARRNLSRDDVVRRIHLHHGASAEKFFASVATESFDFICSNAVLEHLTDPLAALNAMIPALRSGGTMVHIVDLRCHALFKNQGPFEWLKTTPAWHRRLIRHSARPNRVLCHDYRAWAARNTGATLHERGWHGTPELFNHRDDPPSPDAARARAHAESLVRAARATFDPAFSRHADRDLAVSVIALVVKR